MTETSASAASIGVASAVVAAAHGIYLDDYVADVDVSGNTVAFDPGAGIFLHNNYEIVLTGNTIFDNELGILVGNNVDPNIPEPPRNFAVHDNVIVARTPGPLILSLESDVDEFAELGTFDNNRYARPMDDDFTVMRWVRGQTCAAYDVARWGARYGHDLQSHASALQIPTPRPVSSAHPSSTRSRPATRQ